MKTIFQVVSLIGMAIISILSFTIPQDPYKIIPAMTIMSFDKPLWLCYIVGWSFIYLIFLNHIYSKLNNKKKGE